MQDTTVGKSKALVSVVVITYNHHDTIARCLDSILEQKTDFQFEVLVADDASTDGTSDIVREYAKRDDRIRPLINEKNSGAVANCIAALKTISSDFFLITEGDDYWCDPDKLGLQVGALRRHPECSCCGHTTDARGADGKHIYYIARKVRGIEAVFDFMHAPACHITSLLFRNFLPELTDREWRHLTGDGWYLFIALDRGRMVYLNRTMTVYNVTGVGSWTSLSNEQKEEIYQKGSYEMDQFFKFKYTKMFQPRYLPDNPKTLLTITIPLWKGRKLIFKLQKSKPRKAWR